VLVSSALADHWSPRVRRARPRRYGGHPSADEWLKSFLTPSFGPPTAPDSPRR